jgi:hypothetical protein
LFDWICGGGSSSVGKAMSVKEPAFKRGREVLC